MNCKRIQEIIITDYSDGELPLHIRKEIENHLKVCDRCREYERVIRQGAIEPLKRAEAIEPPETTWERIKSSIEEKQERVSLGHLIDNASRLFRVRRPALALATVIVVVIMALAVKTGSFISQSKVTVYLGQQIEFLADLGSEAENGYSYIGYPDLAADVEEYFL